MKRMNMSTKDKEKERTIEFALAKISTEQFAVIESNLPEEGKDIGLGMNFRFSASETQKMLGVFTAFTFQADERQFIIIEAGCHFRIKTEDWNSLLNAEKTELTVPKGLLSHLATITVGTTRGILHVKTENTSFSKYHLPTISVSEVINKDNVFKFIDESK